MAKGAGLTGYLALSPAPGVHQQGVMERVLPRTLGPRGFVWRAGQARPLGEVVQCQHANRAHQGQRQAARGITPLAAVLGEPPGHEGCPALAVAQVHELAHRVGVHLALGPCLGGARIPGPLHHREGAVGVHRRRLEPQGEGHPQPVIARPVVQAGVEVDPRAIAPEGYVGADLMVHKLAGAGAPVWREAGRDGQHVPEPQGGAHRSWLDHLPAHQPGLQGAIAGQGAEVIGVASVRHIQQAVQPL